MNRYKVVKEIIGNEYSVGGIETVLVGHFDSLSAANDVAEKFGCKVMIMSDDEVLEHYNSTAQSRYDQHKEEANAYYAAKFAELKEKMLKDKPGFAEFLASLEQMTED